MTDRARVGALGLLWRQVRYQNRIFWRTPISAFFTFVFPLIFLLLFNLLFADTITTPIGEVPFAQFFTPAIAAFAAVTACYTNNAIQVSITRDEGILKRIRGTPLPPWTYMGGKIASSVWLALLANVVMFAIGALLYDVQIAGAAVGPALTTLVVSAAAFCALGLAVTAIIPTGEASPAVANATVLPVTFISGVFFPVDDAPAWVRTLGDIFPVKHAVDAMVAAFNPLPGGHEYRWVDLAVIAAWGVGGMLLALGFFRWEPKRSAGRAAGRRRERGRDGAGSVAAAGSDD
jgi:ABC-2 type transport system permease protein